jgi:hypothetical protein
MFPDPPVLAQSIADRVRYAFRDFDKEMGSGLALAAGTVLGAVAVLHSFQPDPVPPPPTETPAAPSALPAAPDPWQSFPLALADEEPKEKPVTMKQAAEAFDELEARDEPRRRRRHHGRR